MKARVDFTASDDGGVLVLSMRRIADQVGYCALYEFEDVIVELTGAALVAPLDFARLERARRAYRLVHHATRSPRLADLFRPGAGALRLEHEWELFLPVFNHPHELFALKAVEGWRERCRHAACYICEVWESQLPGYLIELLKDFDHVFIGVKSTAELLARRLGRPCTYVPMGVDALRFCPWPRRPPRPIDVCGLGRRSAVTHAALLDLARHTGRFYFYDTVRTGRVGGAGQALTFHVTDVREHRLLLASLLQRSRYFIANRAWADRPELTLGAHEIAARFYEGAAGGAILLGEPPESAHFREQFGWPDAAVRTPFDAPQIGEVIAALDADPERRARIHRDNAVNALRRFDWEARLRSIFTALGLAPTERMLAREARLRALADEIDGAPLDATA